MKNSVLTLNSKPEPLNLDSAKALGKLKPPGPETPFTPSRYLSFDDTPRSSLFPKFDLDNIDPLLRSAPNSAGLSPKSPTKLDVPRSFTSSLRTEVTSESGDSAEVEPYIPQLQGYAGNSPPRGSPLKSQVRQVHQRTISTSDMRPPSREATTPPAQAVPDYRMQRSFSGPELSQSQAQAQCSMVPGHSSLPASTLGPALQPAEELYAYSQPQAQAQAQDFRRPYDDGGQFRSPYPPEHRPFNRYPYVAQSVRDTIPPNAFGTWSRLSASPSPDRQPYQTPTAYQSSPPPPKPHPQSQSQSQSHLHQSPSRLHQSTHSNPQPHSNLYQPLDPNSPQSYPQPLPPPFRPNPHTNHSQTAIYPSYDGAIRQRDPISMDGTTVPSQWNGMPGFWAKGVIHTWHTGVKPSPTVFRICAQCHTDKPGAKTWRRSKLQKETTLCNKCGIYEHTHHKPRPKRHGDHQFEFSDRAHAETYAYMSTPRGNRAARKFEEISSAGSPVFGVVRRRKPYDRPKERDGDDEDWRP